LLESVRGTTEPLLPNKRMTLFAGSIDGRSAGRNFSPALLEKLQKKGQAADVEDTRDTANSKESAVKAFQRDGKNGGSVCPLREQPDAGRIHCFIFEGIAMNGERLQSDSACG
jgi:hypothetical protein